MCTLRHLTSQIGLNDRVQTQIRDLGGIEMSIQILKRTRCWPIVKAGCGLVRNLAHHYENHEILVDLNIIPRLGEIVVLALKENRKRAKKEKEDLLEKSRKDRLGLVRNDSNASSSSAGFTPVQVDMGDIIEDALGTLAILAESDPNKDPIQDTGVVDLVKDMILRSEVAPQSENVMTVAQALLALYPEEMQEVTEKKRSSMRLNTMGRRPGSE